MSNRSPVKRSGFAAGCEPGSDLFGDQDLLFVAAPNRDDALVLRSADGTELGRRFVGTRQDRWITVGRRVLCCQSIDQQLVVRWFDAWDRAGHLEAGICPPRSQCWMPARDELAVLEPSGKFTAPESGRRQRAVRNAADPEPELARCTCCAVAIRTWSWPVPMPRPRTRPWPAIDRGLPWDRISARRSTVASTRSTRAPASRCGRPRPK